MHPNSSGLLEKNHTNTYEVIFHVQNTAPLQDLVHIEMKVFPLADGLQQGFNKVFFFLGRGCLG